jgi:hypothetical protein
VATGAEAVQPADRGAQGGGGDEADAAGPLQALAAQVASGELGKLLFDCRHRALGIGDGVEDRLGRGAQRHGQVIRGVFQCREHGRPDLGRAPWNHDAELAQEPAQQVDRRGAVCLVELTHAVQALDTLLFAGFHWHRADVPAAGRFQQTRRIGAVGLVASHIRAHRERRQQGDGVPEALEMARPMMRGATRLHHDVPGRHIVESMGKRRA